MHETRPTSIFAIALLHIVIGCLGVAWNGAGLIALVRGNELAAEHFTPQQRENLSAVEQAMTSRAPMLLPYQVVVTQLVPWLLTAALLVAGVGLLRSRPWARTLSVWYAVVSILHKMALAAYTIVYLEPFYKTPIFLLEVSKPELSRGTEMVAVASMVITPLVLMLYPLLVLIVMYRPKVMLALSPRVGTVQAVG
ncbi:hypothetical protein AYO44_01225 [Planctomycetaceae bacterium SCGC AG-212-F19]|nr:hypothetical protein AYO44_01225 [Planctomycetaceae bacterium SCGC AG-212-F19]